MKYEDGSVDVWILECQDNKSIWFKEFSAEKARHTYNSLRDKAQFNLFIGRETWNHSIINKTQVVNF